MGKTVASYGEFSVCCQLLKYGIMAILENYSDYFVILFAFGMRVYGI